MEIVQAIAIAVLAIISVMHYFVLSRVEDKVDRLATTRTPPRPMPRAFRRDIDNDEE